jgi:reactive intermediate/imine deaminase
MSLSGLYFFLNSAHRKAGGLYMATKTVGRSRVRKSSVAKARSTATVKKKTAPSRKTVVRARKKIDPGWTWDDGLPLAQAQQIGDAIYVSGQVAYNANGQLVGEGDMKAQTRQVFQNIQDVLAAAGARMQDIIKINTYITDQSKFMEMLETRKEVFGNNPPASTAVVVAGLAFPGLLIEVEAIAVKS